MVQQQGLIHGTTLNPPCTHPPRLPPPPARRPTGTTALRANCWWPGRAERRPSPTTCSSSAWRRAQRLHSGAVAVTAVTARGQLRCCCVPRWKRGSHSHTPACQACVWATRQQHWGGQGCPALCIVTARTQRHAAAALYAPLPAGLLQVPLQQAARAGPQAGAARAAGAHAKADCRGARGGFWEGANGKDATEAAACRMHAA